MSLDTISNDDKIEFILRSSLFNSNSHYNFCNKSDVLNISVSSSQNPIVVDLPLIQSHMLVKKISSPSTEACFDSPIQQQDQLKKISQVYNRLEENYHNHKIDTAYQLSVKYQKLCKNQKIEIPIENKKFIRQVHQEMEDVSHYERIVHQDGWKIQKTKKNLRVSTIIEGHTVGVLIQAQLNIPIQHFLSVITEIDLMKNYMPFMKESKQEKIVSRNCRIGHSINNFPIISQRQAFFQGIGYDRMDYNSTVILYSRSITDRPDLQQLLDYQVITTEKATQLDYKYLVIEYKPSSPNSGSIRFALNIDMKLRLPMFILMPATQNFGVDFYKNILKIAENFKGSEWQKRALENPEFFNLVHRRIQQIFKDTQSKKIK